MRKLHFLMAITIGAIVGSQNVLLAQHEHRQQQEQQGMQVQDQTKDVYTCPMHPDVVSDRPGKCPQCGMKLVKKTAKAPEQETKGQSKSMTDMMGKPTAERTVDGLRVQFWLITQDEHKEMRQEQMKTEKKDTGEMKHDRQGTDHSKMGKDMKGETKEADHSKMMAGTHHLMVMVLDDKSGQAVGDGHITVAVTAPSGKSSTVHLAEMMGHFGGGVSLTEKGAYKFALSFKSGAKTHNALFEYAVK